jgi:hypothetical protein
MVSAGPTRAASSQNRVISANSVTCRIDRRSFSIAKSCSGPRSIRSATASVIMSVAM